MHVVFIENTQLEAYGKVAIETSLVDKASFSFSIYIALSIWISFSSSFYVGITAIYVYIAL